MNDTWHIIRGSLILIIALGCIGWVFWKALRKSEDPGRLTAKWILTFVLLCITIFKIAPIVAGGGAAAAASIPFLAAVGIILGLIWAPSWATMLFKPLTNMFDGGDADGEITVQYSVAEARRARGQFREAIEEIRKQLEAFPTDLRLQLLLAEIHVQHLNDLQAAQVIIHRLVQQKHSPANIASAHHQLADWHLKYGQDPESARIELERIIERFPETQFSQTASERIAHLTTVDRLLQQHDLPTLKLKEYERDLGITGGRKHSSEALQESNRAGELVTHLAQFPLDNNAREELARVYAEQYGRVDMAIEQLEQLIAQPDQKARNVVRWLELSADLHIKVGKDSPSAEAALRRIIALFPNSAGSEMAQRRLATLQGELNANKKSQVLKLGSYEKDIGLKAKKPTVPRVE